MAASCFALSARSAFISRSKLSFQTRNVSTETRVPSNRFRSASSASLLTRSCSSFRRLSSSQWQLRNYSKSKLYKRQQRRNRKGFKLANEENRCPLFPIPYELSSCKDGRFNMETLRDGRILTPKCIIAANRYWIGLLKPRPEMSMLFLQKFKMSYI